MEHGPTARHYPSRRRPPLIASAEGVYSRAEALAEGWTDSAIRHAVRFGRSSRIKRGALAETSAQPDFDDGRRALRAANLQFAVATAKLCGRGAISHSSALIALDLPTVCPVRRPCLTVPAGTALRTLAGVHLHRARLTDTEIVEVRSLRVTSVARTILDVAREHGVDAGVVAADAALNRGLLTQAELDCAGALCRGWPGGRRASATLALSNALAESPLESLSRLRMVTCDLPTPQLQVRLGDELGRSLARTDFYWPQFGVVGEADGAVKYETRAVLVDERRRQAALEDLGLVVVRWGWSDLPRFELVARRLRAAFERGVGAGNGQRWSLL